LSASSKCKGFRLNEFRTKVGYLTVSTAEEMTASNCIANNKAIIFITLFFSFSLVSTTPKPFPKDPNLLAGAAKVPVQFPLGVPLAGFNHGARRVATWPIPEPKPYSNFMTGNIGHINPIWVKTVVVTDGSQPVAFITLDGIGSDSSLCLLAYEIAKDNGFKVPLDNCLFSASHSHSGPGAVSGEFLWEMAPASDLLVPEIQLLLATSMALSMTSAQQRLQPAKINIGIAQLLGVTKNRRAGLSPYLSKGSIDPNLGVLRVDDAQGNSIATIWNFALHGVCYGPDNMMFSSDIMGLASDLIEENVGGVALFINGDAGDIDPGDGMCDNKPSFRGSPIIAEAVVRARDSLTPSTDVTIKAYSERIPFGPTDLNFTLERFANCSTGGPLDICSLCTILRCDVNLHMYSNWVENNPRFTAFAFRIGNQNSVVVSMPGEPLLELGWWVRNDTKDLGFDNTFLAGYSNNHMSYFATPREYDVGGYESQGTLWGIDTAVKVRQGCKTVAQKLSPKKKAR